MKYKNNMGYQVYQVGKRFGGYGVPTICEHPDCNEEIDRGVSYACGDEPFSEIGCDRYFCSKHLVWYTHNESTGKKCKHKRDCDCRNVDVCERCANNKSPFPYKPEHKDWVHHLLTDESWQEWRNENKEEVKEMQNILTPHIT